MNCLMVRKIGWLLMVCFMMSATIFAAMDEKQMNTKTEDMKSGMKEQMQHQGMKDQMQHKDMEKVKPVCDITGRTGHLQSAEDLIGMNVYNKQDQKLGNVEELVLDNNRKAVCYVVITSNDTYYPVPWTAFDTGTTTYILDISPANLHQAPTVSSLQISQFSSEDLKNKTQDYYSNQISAAQKKSMSEQAMKQMKEKAGEMMNEGAKPALCEANQIIGEDVQDMQGKKLGELSDVVFDVREGNLAYGLVSFGGLLGFREKTAAVPWDAIQMKPGQQIVRLNADESMLRDAVLPRGNLRSLSEPEFARQVHRDFGQEPYWEVFGFVAPAGTEMMEMSIAPWQADSVYNKSFDTSTVETIQGTVRQVGSFTPEKDAAEGLKLKVETPDGKTVTVYAGPKKAYMMQKIRFQKGDQISITGSRTTVNQKNVIMASQIQKGTDTLRLRDAQGKPVWQMTGMEQPGMQHQQGEQQKEMPADTPPRY